MRAPIANRWTPFGLDRDPFFQNELSASDEALYAAETFFVGRQDELERVATTVGSGTSSCTVIEGDAGVGKTSFVNTLKARLAAGGVLTHENPIRVLDDTSFHTLVTEILRTLLAIRSTQLDAGTERFRTASARTEQLWEKVAMIAEGKTHRGGSVGVPGFSVGTSASTVAPQGTGDRYFDEVQRALADLSARGRVPVLLHIDNLENLRDADLERAATLLRNLRDYLLIPGGHWIVVGKTGVTQDVFEVREEVGSITAQPVSLAPLLPGELRLLLDVRYQALRRGRRFTPPVELPVAEALYARFYGDLRSFLQLLSRAAERALPADGQTPMSEAMILGAVGALYRERMTKRVGEEAFRALELALRAVAPATEFRAADLARVAGVSRARATQVVEKLLEKKVVRRLRQEESSKYLAPTGETSVALDAILRAGGAAANEPTPSYSRHVPPRRRGT
ncbi:MAG: ATP-binding protein [Gemmatimonadaceae bacterium]